MTEYEITILNKDKGTGQTFYERDVKTIKITIIKEFLWTEIP
jgi:hypothetical protein